MLFWKVLWTKIYSKWSSDDGRGLQRITAVIFQPYLSPHVVTEWSESGLKHILLMFLVSLDWVHLNHSLSVDFYHFTTSGCIKYQLWVHKNHVFCQVMWRDGGEKRRKAIKYHVVSSIFKPNVDTYVCWCQKSQVKLHALVRNPLFVIIGVNTAAVCILRCDLDVWIVRFVCVY